MHYYGEFLMFRGCLDCVRLYLRSTYGIAAQLERFILKRQACGPCVVPQIIFGMYVNRETWFCRVKGANGRVASACPKLSDNTFTSSS